MMKGMEGERGRGCCFFVMVMAMAMQTMTAMATMMGMINYCLLHESNGMITVLYILLFLFDENARENLWAIKGMGGGRRLVD